jgi:hypothetical protein
VTDGESAKDAKVDLDAEDQPDPAKTEENDHPEVGQDIRGEQTEAAAAESEPDGQKQDPLHRRRPQTPPRYRFTKLSPEHRKRHKDKEGHCSAEHASVYCGLKILNTLDGQENDGVARLGRKVRLAPVETTNCRHCCVSSLVIFDDTEHKARKIDAARNQRPQAGKDREIAFEQLEPAPAFHDDRVGSLHFDQCRQHIVQQLLAVEDGHQQPHSVSFEALEGFEKGLSAVGGDQGFEGLCPSRETRQPG